MICRGHVGIMEKKMELLFRIIWGYLGDIYRGCIGIMEKKMQTTI